MTQLTAEQHFEEGLAHLKAGDWGKAITSFTKVIEAKPPPGPQTLAAAYCNRGTAWQNKSEYDKAIEDYTQAIELNPKLADTYFNRGNAWGLQGNPDKAIEDFTQGNKLNPNYQPTAIAAWRWKAIERLKTSTRQ